MGNTTVSTDSQYWSKHLQSHPENEKDCPWDKLNDEAWCAILQEHPEYIRHAPKTIPQSFMRIDQWLKVLLRHPELDPYFPGGRSLLAATSDNVGALWAQLLARHPQFSKYSPWKRLEGKDWMQLLCQQPQFLANYNGDRAKTKAKAHSMSPSQIAELIACQPQLFPAFGLSALAPKDWVTLLKKQPQFRSACPLNTFPAEETASILACHPEWIEFCNISSKSPWDILVIAEKFPEILRHYDLEKFRTLGLNTMKPWWIEKHPILVPYTTWKFKYQYWDALLKRLSYWYFMGKHPKMNFSDYMRGPMPTSWGSIPRHKLAHQGYYYGENTTRPISIHDYGAFPRNALDTIMASYCVIESMGNQPEKTTESLTPQIVSFVSASDLTYEKTRIWMDMNGTPENEMLLLGLCRQKRFDIVCRILANEDAEKYMPYVLNNILQPLSKCSDQKSDTAERPDARQIALEVFFPLAIVHTPSPDDLVTLLDCLHETKNDAVIHFLDATKNNALHYAFFRMPCQPEVLAEGKEAPVFQKLKELGVDPDAPDADGFSYTQLRQYMEGYLLGIYPPQKRIKGPVRSSSLKWLLQ